MWRTKYKDYPLDEKWKKERRETGRAIIGCEMNERYGWGEKDQIEEQSPSRLRKWLNRIFRNK